MIISFTGMDGTGKTFYSRWLYVELKKRGYQPVYVHILSYKTILTQLLKVGRKLINGSKVTSFQNPYHPRKTSLLKLWPILVIIDSYLTYYLRLKRISSGRVLLCDRYFYDIVAIIACLGIIGYESAYKIINMIPRPDLTFMLETSAVTAYNRKMEHPFDFYCKQQSFYLRMKSIINPIVINTESLSIRETKNRILKSIEGRL